MRLTLLGTGNAGQVPVYNCHCAACRRARCDKRYRRGPCCALIEHEGQRWLLDSGLMDLAERFPPHSLSGIVQTHYHPDHAQGLLHLRWGQGVRIPVLGPPDPTGLADLYQHPGILDFSTSLRPFEPVQLGSLSVTAVPLAHSRLTYGYVFMGGDICFAYLTDTLGLPPETRGYLRRQRLDLVALDCSFAPQPHLPRNHNDLTRALETLEQLQFKNAVLTHVGHGLDAWLIANPHALPDGVSIARDGDMFQYEMASTI